MLENPGVALPSFDQEEWARRGEYAFWDIHEALEMFRLLREATLTWVGALAAAPIVLMYPLFLVIFGRSATTIVMIGFAAGLEPVILKTVEGLA